VCHGCRDANTDPEYKNLSAAAKQVLKEISEMPDALKMLLAAKRANVSDAPSSHPKERHVSLSAP
jgi:hypothetical protein